MRQAIATLGRSGPHDSLDDFQLTHIPTNKCLWLIYIHLQRRVCEVMKCSFKFAAGLHLVRKVEGRVVTKAFLCIILL